MALVHNRVLATIAALCLLLVSSEFLTGGQLQQKISDAAFWRMISEFSEPEGKFESNPNNFVSNESSFQTVIPKLKDVAPGGGGVYIGVGPDQNFTYVIALEPVISFIVDIRRQNMLQHLMYKALIELSADRTDFLSLLFSRPRPQDAGSESTPRELFDAYAATPANAGMRVDNLQAILDRLIRRHGFELTPADERIIEFIHRAFYEVGPDLTYTGARSRMPTYAQLLTGNDGQNLNRSYLATEGNFQILKQLQENNLIVPLVGDFAGDKAFRAVGGWLKSQNVTVTALYTSNVEQYLFEEPGQPAKFYTNVASLPLDSRSVFVRAFLNASPRAPGGVRGSVTLLSPIQEFLKAVED